MPGRVSTRSARSSTAAVSRKSSTQTLKSRTTSARQSALAVEIPDEGPATSLRDRIASIFAEAQRSVATQRKLCVNLRKVQETCCYEPVSSGKKAKNGRDLEDFGEEEFNDEVGRCVLRVLPVKKSEPVGDKIVKFVGLFLKHASEKDNALVQPEDVDATEAFPETPSSRLTSHILSLLLPLLAAKDKVVRFRATQIIALVVNTLDSIEDELFQLIRLGLLKRIRDKESAVRVQAVLGLGRLAGEGDEGRDDEDSDDEDAGGVLEKLLNALQNDPSAEVRRSLLLNLPFTPATLPYLLERARDLDPATRRVLFARLLPALGDFRHLSLTHREKLLRWGLRDRDDNVRKATARLFRERWIEDCVNSRQPSEEAPPPPGQLSAPNVDALLELLERIDVVNSGVEGGIAFEAMKDFWDGRPDYRESIAFEDEFWLQLTPESAFVARSFNEYCRQSDENKVRSVAEDKMPEVTKFAFFLQKHLNVLIEDVQKVALQDDAEAEEDTVQQEFCVEQLLHIALTLDYTDEIGRRQMFSIMREALALAELPEECTKLVVEVLRTACGSNTSGEREFCGIVLEAIAEVHDTIMGEDATQQEDAEESFHSAQSVLSEINVKPKGQSRDKPRETSEDPSEVDEQRAIREIMVNMKCLHIAQCMLQNVLCDLEANSDLVTMLNNLVVPAVRSQEAPIRERGLTCLGLCCQQSKNLAEENLSLFLHCFTKGHEELQIIAVQIIADILITHPSLLAPVAVAPSDASSPDESGGPVQNPILKPLVKTFQKAILSPSIQVPLTAAVALSKLLLLQVLPQAAAADVLRSLTLAYFSPDTASNPGFRQALSYFLPVYCHSRRKNACAVAQIAVYVTGKLVGIRDEVDEEDEDAEAMVGWSVVAGMFAEWTDGRRIVDSSAPSAHTFTTTTPPPPPPEEEPHILLAADILARVVQPSCSREERKPLLTLLSKLHVPPPAAPLSRSALAEGLHAQLHALAVEAADARVAVDAAGRNALAKLQAALEKALGDAVAGGGAEETMVALDEEDTVVPEREERDGSGEEGTSVVEAVSSEGRTEMDEIAESLLETEI